MTDIIHYAETAYGFQFGSADVARLTHIKGTAFIQIGTKQCEIQIRCTKTGRMTIKCNRGTFYTEDCHPKNEQRG